MKQKFKKTAFKLLIGCRLRTLKRTCDLIMFDFAPITDENSYIALHAECFVRAYRGATTLFCSEDMYFERSDREIKEFEWDKPGDSRFYYSVEKNQKHFVGKAVTRVTFKNNRLELRIENGVAIELIQNSVDEEHESYLLFTNTETLYSV